MVLAINEGFVRTENVELGPEGEISPARLLSEGFKFITEKGVLGDTMKATTEPRKVIIQNVMEAYAENIRIACNAV